MTSPWTIFLVIARCFTFGFGAMMTLIRREAIHDRHWLTEDEFLDMIALGNLLPGSNPVNLAVLIGMHVRGWVGAGAAFLGAVLPGFTILMVLGTLALGSHAPWMQGALRGCAALAVGITIGNSWQMTHGRLSTVNTVLILAVGLAVIVLHFSLSLTLVIFVPVALVLTNLDVIRKKLV